MKTDKQKKFVIGLSIAVMLAGWAAGILFIANSMTGFLDDIELLFANTGIFGILGFAATFIITDTLLFFVSGLSSAFISIGNILLPIMTSFIVCSISMFIVSMLVYEFGKKFGTKAFLWAFSEKDYVKASSVISSPTVIALALLFPGFPDTLICFFAGAGKIKPLTFAIIALLTRTIGVASICFLGSGILSIEVWKQSVDAIGLIPTLAIIFSMAMAFISLIVGAFAGGKWLEKKFAKKQTETEVK